MNSKWSRRIQQGLKTNIIGHTIVCYPCISSTNDIAKELARPGVKEGAVVIAREQTHGRGRLHGNFSRKWVSPPGGLYASIILKPDIAPIHAPKLAIVSAIAIANILRDQYHLEAGVKWPNDVLVANKKICGILIEGNTKNELLNYVVVGLGINVNVSLDKFPVDLQETTTSIQNELGTEISMIGFIQQLLSSFEQLYVKFKNKNLSPLLDLYENIFLTPGQWVRIQTVHETLEGIAQGIDSNGGLILKLPDNSIRQVLSGEVVQSKRI